MHKRRSGCRTARDGTPRRTCRTGCGTQRRGVQAQAQLASAGKIELVDMARAVHSLKMWEKTEKNQRPSARASVACSLAPARSLARSCQCTSRRTLCVPLRMSPCMLCAGKIRENKIKVFAHTHARTRARTRAHLRARRCWWTRAGGAGRRSSRRSHGCATRPRAREARRSLRHTARADRSHSEVSLFRSFAHSDVSRIRTDVSAGAHAAGAAAGLPRAEHPLCGGDQGRRREIHGKPKAATEGSPQLAICGLQHGGCVAHGSCSAGRRPMGAAAHVGAFVQAARH